MSDLDDRLKAVGDLVSGLVEKHMDDIEALDDGTETQDPSLVLALILAERIAELEAEVARLTELLEPEECDGGCPERTCLRCCSDRLAKLEAINAELEKVASYSLLKQNERLKAENARLLKIKEAAECIRHWHDSGSEGMVVSAEHVRLLWEALEAGDDS